MAAKKSDIGRMIKLRGALARWRIMLLLIIYTKSPSIYAILETASDLPNADGVINGLTLMNPPPLPPLVSNNSLPSPKPNEEKIDEYGQ